MVNINGRQMLQPAAPNDNGPDVKEMTFLDIPQNDLYIPPVSFVLKSIDLFYVGRF